MASKGGDAHAKKQKQAEIDNRRKIVAANLLAGADYRDMAAALNVSPATIASDVKELLKHWRQQSVREMDAWISLQLRRHDVMLNALWSRVKDGDDRAIETALRILDKQAQLLGVPQRLDVTTKGEAVKVETTIALPPMQPLEAMAAMELYRQLLEQAEAGQLGDEPDNPDNA